MAELRFFFCFFFFFDVVIEDTFLFSIYIYMGEACTLF